MTRTTTGIFSRKHVLLFAFMLLATFMCGQVQDTARKDTLDIYKKIRKIAYRHKTTKMLYKAVFTDPAPQKYEKKPLSDKQKKTDPNKRFEGKIIRSVEVEVYDPFGHSVNDTTKTLTNGLQKLGNRYHVTTRKRIIRNLLLFEVGDSVDLFKITESERLLRTARYVSDARIFIIQNGSSRSDSVNIKILVQDKWNITIPGGVSTRGVFFTVRDRNMLGSGQQFEQYVKYNINGEYQFTGRYSVPNISHSFISSLLYYTTTPDVTQTGFSLDRTFYSADAKWAGGLAGYKLWGTYRYTDLEENLVKEKHLDYYNLDTWLGRSFKVKTGTPINRRVSNVVLALRYNHTQYVARPDFTLDTNKIFVNSTLYLGSAGFSQSKYYKDQFIFRFGANEDIPEGAIFQVLYGVQVQEEHGLRYYAGVDASRGRHFEKIGYFSANGTYGTFFNREVRNNATVKLGLSYFTNLLRSGRWYFRQFAYLSYVDGINKMPYERVTLRTQDMYGFNAGPLAGTAKIWLNLESVTYLPYSLIGFKFAPVVLIGAGMLQHDKFSLFEGQVYQSLALGMLFRNENLLTNTFRLTFGFYPSQPDNPNHTKFNPVTSFSVRFRTFFIARPEVITYD